MLIFISRSATPRVKPLDCKWFRFLGKKSVSVENEESKSIISERAIYGIKLVRDKHYLILRTDLKTVFPIDAKTLRSLLGRSRVFRGLVQGKRVSTQITAVPNKPAITPNPVQRPVEYQVEHVPKRGEESVLTKQIRSARIDGAKTLKFLSTVMLPSNQRYFYYDATEVRDKNQDDWDNKLEKAVLKTVPKEDHIVGATMMKHNGKEIPVLIIVREE